MKYVNIILVCLDGEFNKSISKELAGQLDMFFADLESYIEYDLIDSKAILEKCGIDYLEQRELKASQAFSKFENSVLTVNFDLFKKNRKAFGKNSLVVYLRLPKKSLSSKENLNILSFDNRDQYLLKNCNIVVGLRSKLKSKAMKELLLGLEEAI